jgi:hypothetical protein
MTRDEANAVVVKHGYGVYPGGQGANLIDVLVDLGLLRLETTSGKDRDAAVDRLHGMYVSAVAHGVESTTAKLTLDGAAEIVDVLTKSGFRITKEPA